MRVWSYLITLYIKSKGNTIVFPFFVSLCIPKQKDMTNVNEIWIPAYNYENIYEVSNLGRVKRKLDNFIYKPRKMSNGYLFVGLRKNKGEKQKNISIHRLVLSSFNGFIENKDVNHIDGNKQNNHLQNLEWVSRKENIKHAFDIGIVKKGLSHHNSHIYVHKEYGFFVQTHELVKLHGCSNNFENKDKWLNILKKYIKL